MMKYLRNFLFCACIWLLGSWNHALGQTFPTFDQVDYVTVQDFSVFQSIWGKAETENVRIALFGDSQETAPGGAGAIYIPRLNYKFYQHFGKVGESFAATGFGSYGGDWLLNGSFGNSRGHSDGTLAANQLLAGQQTRIYTSSALGMNTHLDTSNFRVNAGAQIPTTYLWDSNDQIYVEIFGATNIGSDELSWRSIPVDGGANFFRPATSSGTTNMGLDSPFGQILSETIGPLNSGGLPEHQIIVRGEGSSGAELVGVRYFNTSDPGGVSIQEFSAGGYLTSSHINNHSNAGTMLAAFGSWDAVIIHTGANDAYSGPGKSALDFKHDVAELIELIRSPSWLNNANQKFILITDQYRDQGPQSQNDQFDQYAGVLADFALNDSNIMAVNSRSLTEELGWNENDPDRFLFDIVHYNSNGAIVLAAIESQLMLNGGLVGDFDVDIDVDIDDIDRYAANIGVDATGELTLLDFDADGNITRSDLQVHIETFVQTSNGRVGTFLGDLNLDGNVDVLNDAFRLISRLGTSVTSYAEGDINVDGTVDVLNDAFELIANLGNSNSP